MSSILIGLRITTTVVALSPIIIGFGTAGVAAGSIAAGIQAGIGNVVAGSIFASVQTFVMGGAATTVATTGVGATVLGFLTKLF